MKQLLFICYCACIVLLLTNCSKVEFTTDSNIQLEFSLDTLRFDTVFTERGSITDYFKIYNTAKEYIRISDIELSSNSFFRLNVDGISGNRQQNIEIPPEDSIYVFVEVTIDPNLPLTESPYVITDQIRFVTNGNEQVINLEAWGQDANYLPRLNAGGTQSLLTCDLGQVVWDDPKPYVLFGVLIVDSCELVLPPGTELYIHGGFGRLPDGSIYNDGIIFFLRNGRFTVNGTAEEPVLIQGDRLEEVFNDGSGDAGQWGRIQFGALSRGHSIKHAIIKQPTVGLLVDSLAQVTLENTQIFYSSSSALLGYRADVTAINCLFHSSGSNNVTIILGGNYSFTYCTMANFGSPSAAFRATNFTCLDGTPLCTNPIASRLNLRIRNSIIAGSTRDEIILQDITGGDDPDLFRYDLTNCIVRIDELLDEGGQPDFFDNCEQCINWEMDGNLFSDIDNDNYQLDTLSIAENMAVPIASIPIDILNAIRDTETPDIGCYEYMPN